MPDRPRRRDEREAAVRRHDGRATRRRTRVASAGLTVQRWRAPAPRASRRRIRPTATIRTSPSASSSKTTAASPPRLRAAPPPSRGRADRAAPPHRRSAARCASSASAGEMTSSPVPILRQQRARRRGVGEIAFGAEPREDGRRLGRGTARRRSRAALRDEPADREVAERRLVALAQQVEQRRALREVVIRVGGRAAFSRSAPRSRRYSAHAAGATRGSSVSATAASRSPASAMRSAAVSASAAISVACSASKGGAPAGDDVVGEPDGFVERAALQREPRAQHAHRPFVPVAGLAAVGAVGVARAAEELAGRRRSGRESDESARACRRPRPSFRGTESGCGLRARGAAPLRRASGRRAARRSARAWRARPPARVPTRALREATTLRSASASACS